MRTVVFGGASTLDNFIARPDGGVDWILWGKEAAALMAEFWPRFDTIVMGRKTFEFAQRFGQTGGYPGMANYVFSRTLSGVPAGVTLVRDDAAEFIRGLKGAPGKDICVMGGGEFAHALFEADVIDEVGLNIHPVLLGQGVPLFHRMTRDIRLELERSRQLSNGCVLVNYRVVH